MPFVDSARAAVQQFALGHPTRVVLEYLLENALGRHQARPWSEIGAHLNEHGIAMTREQFQQTILAETRSGDIFIGSNDHAPGRGYFIIENRADADFAREFYTRRIAAQQTNLDQLDRLIERHQFQ
jgi:hypothetical protein